MHINKVNQGAVPYGNAQSKPPKPDKNFRDFLDKNNGADEAAKPDDAAPIPQGMAICAQGMERPPLPQRTQTAPFVELIRESARFFHGDVKKDIDAICGDETGENIDLGLLEYFLDLYIEVKQADIKQL